MKKAFVVLKILTLSIVLKFIYGTNRKIVKGKNNYTRLIRFFFTVNKYAILDYLNVSYFLVTS